MWIARVRRLALIGLVVVCAVAVGSALASPKYTPFYDAHIFYACMDVAHRGENPYDPARMQGVYTRLYGDSVGLSRYIVARAPCHQSPLTMAAFVPLALLPLSSRFLVWLFVSAAALIGATLLTTRLWPGEGGGAAAQRRLLLIAAGPLAVWVLYLGQVDTVQLLAWVLGLRWMERGRYRLAGAIVVLGLMKPWVLAGPFLLLAVLARRRGRLRAYLSGALAGLAIALLVTLPVGGPAMWRSWAMFIATASVTRETDIASITGLAVTWLPAGIVHALAVCWIVAWAAVCALALRRMACAQAGERQWLLCGATAWLVISPFAHSYDSLPLIVPALWLVWSRDERRGRGERWTGSLPWCVWWVCGVASIIPAAVVPGIRGWGALPLLVATVALWRNPAVAPPVAGVSPSGAALGGGAPDGDTPPQWAIGRV